VKVELEKLAYLRRLDAHELDLSMLPDQRRRFLARIADRATPQQLARRDPPLRYPILLAWLSSSAVEVLDEVLLMFDQAISGREHHAKEKVKAKLAERAKSGESRQKLLDDILDIVLDTAVGRRAGRHAVARAGRHGADASARDSAPPRLPRDHGHLAELDASIGYLRQFAPYVLGAVRFAGGTDAAELLKAVSMLTELYATGNRKVPEPTQEGFVPIRWRGYLADAKAAGDITAYRHYWELCVLLGLRDGLRCGDVHVSGSRRFADPASFLLTAAEWEPQRTEYCHLVDRPASFGDALAVADDQLHTHLIDLERLLAAGGGTGEVRLGDDGELIIPRLDADIVPAEANDLRAELSAMIPRLPIASLLVEMDQHTGFLEHLTHAGGKVLRSPELKRNLILVLLAEAMNMGLTAMAEASGVPYDVLAWTAEWYLRPETLEPANAAIVNHHHRLPMTQHFGDGTLSSSDGQRFPIRGKSLTGRHLSRYFAAGQGFTTYTHVSDQHTTYATKVIMAYAPEAHYALDGIFGNITDLPITEHSTDTAAATMANFALFDLTGLLLSPRIKDLGRITLYRTGAKAEFETRYPHAGPLLTRRLNTELIRAHWDDLLRVAASVKYGHCTASMVVGKLCSAKRQQNALAAAIKEWGALRRTLFVARVLVDKTFRRRIARQLNKGENVHALKRDIFHAHEGAVRRRHHEQQTEQAWCLTLVTNAVVTWMTEYFGLAVARKRARGEHVDDDLLAHIWPTHHENVNFMGSIRLDVTGELAELNADGYRPLRDLDVNPGEAA
jgi:TnpA family transposase